MLGYCALGSGAVLTTVIFFVSEVNQDIMNRMAAISTWSQRVGGVGLMAARRHPIYPLSKSGLIAI